MDLNGQKCDFLPKTNGLNSIRNFLNNYGKKLSDTCEIFIKGNYMINAFLYKMENNQFVEYNRLESNTYIDCQCQ